MAGRSRWSAWRARAPYWDAVRQHQFSEVWLRAADEGQALAMLVNQQDAWLIYLGQDEDNLSYHLALRFVSIAGSCRTRASIIHSARTKAGSSPAAIAEIPPTRR